MSDLYIDGAMLDRVKDSFRNIEQLLSGPAKQMKDVDASEMGPADLVDRVHTFGSEWGYGIEQLGEFSGSVVDALDSIRQAFDKAETNLADALNNAKGH